MLVIRQSQLAIFREHLLERFRARATAHLRENFPEECQQLGPISVDQRVSSGMDLCQQYGLTTDFQHLQFLNLTMLLGPDFHKEPEFAEILDNKDLDARTKLDRVDELAILRLGAP
jgi:hypothetical protein